MADKRQKSIKAHVDATTEGTESYMGILRQIGFVKEKKIKPSEDILNYMFRNQCGITPYHRDLAVVMGFKEQEIDSFPLFDTRMLELILAGEQDDI